MNKRKTLMIVAAVLGIIGAIMMTREGAISAEYDYYEDNYPTLYCFTAKPLVIETYEDYVEQAEICDVPIEYEESFFEDGVVILYEATTRNRSIRSVRLQNDTMFSSGTTIRIKTTERSLFRDDDTRFYVIGVKESDLNSKDIDTRYYD